MPPPWGGGRGWGHSQSRPTLFLLPLLGEVPAQRGIGFRTPQSLRASSPTRGAKAHPPAHPERSEGSRKLTAAHPPRAHPERSEGSHETNGSNWHCRGIPITPHLILASPLRGSTRAAGDRVPQTPQSLRDSSPTRGAEPPPPSLTPTAVRGRRKKEHNNNPPAKRVVFHFRA